jgi:hypothetical protein
MASGRRPSRVTRGLLAAAAVALYVLHQDWWNWRRATPLVFGFVPVGLFYHVCYSLAAVLLMALVVRFAWPDHLDPDETDGPPDGARR